MDRENKSKGRKIVEKRTPVMLEEVLYYIGAAILLGTKGIGLGEETILFRICFMAGCLLIGCKVLLNSYTIKEILVMAGLGIWGIYTFFSTGSLGMLIYIVLIAGMKNVSLLRLFKVEAVLWAVCVFITVTWAIFGNRKGVVLVHEKFGLGPILRESLGYTHPNVLQITYVVLMAFVLYSCNKKGKELLKVMFVLFVLDCFIFMHSLSVTGLLMSLLYLFVHYYLISRQRIGKAEKAGISILPFLCVVISIILPLLGGDGRVFQIINKVFNSRLLAIRVFFYHQGFSLFGATSDLKGFALDNSFASALIGYGVIFFCIIIVTYYLLLRFCLKKDMRAEMAIICAFLIGGISEPFLFNASVKNITVFFIGYYMYSALKKTDSRDTILNKNILFLSKWNIPVISEKKAGFSVIKFSFTIGCAACVVTAVIMLVLFVKPGKIVDQVYVNQTLCDCDGELVSSSNIGQANTILCIGDRTAGDMFYYFTNENSNLIKIMNYVYKISIIFYFMGSILLFVFLYNRQKHIEERK